ncbi:MAG: hypothetical protein K0R24_2155 [Gammaproteobacteria bacterium]|jgi:hypothetical protein|nr:hypothetical protein [Gammaproteobacteria bacterium]
MIAKKLHKFKKKIRRKAGRIGLCRLKIRPPFLPPYFPKETDQKSLHLVASTDVAKFKPLEMNRLENWLQKKLGLKIFIETKNTLRVSAKNSPFMEEQNKLFFASSVALKHIQKNIPLDDQWRIQFNNSQIEKKEIASLMHEQEEKPAALAQNSESSNEQKLKNICENGHTRIDKEKQNILPSVIESISSRSDTAKVTHNCGLWKKDTSVNFLNNHHNGHSVANNPSLG